MREMQQTNLKNAKETKSTGNKPVLQYRAGVISVSLWENEGKEYDGKPSTFLTAQIQRGYKDKNGEWQNTGTLRVNDIPVVQMLLQKAFESAKTMKKPSEED